MDFISILTGHALTTDRYIQIDIDDCFVGADGTRNTKADVQEILTFQNHWKQRIPGFQFYVGFSGGSRNRRFERWQENGRRDEIEWLGDEKWIQEAKEFKWFGHMWSHLEAWKINSSEVLCEQMEENS